MSHASDASPGGRRGRSPQRKPNAVDVHVGDRLRLRRRLLGMSQAELAAGLGLALQQVQKYEAGVNRVSASRLYQLSQLLEVPIAWFFEEMPGDIAPAATPARDLVRVYARIEDEALRRKLYEIAKTFAASDGG